MTTIKKKRIAFLASFVRCVGLFYLAAELETKMEVIPIYLLSAACGILWLCMGAVTLAGVFLKNRSGYAVFAVADLIVAAVILAYAIHDIRTDVGWFAGLLGMLLIIFVLPINAVLLAIDLIAWYIDNKKKKKMRAAESGPSVSKEELRSSMKAVRKRIENREERSGRIADLLLNSELYKQSDTIAMYRSMGSEVDTSRMLQAAAEDGKIVVLPRVEGDSLVMYRYAPGDTLEVSSFGVKEPIADESRKAVPEKISLVIVPGLCFDKDKNRLGYGKGYYDRFLSGCPAKRIGVCFEEQLLEKGAVPANENDIKMDHIITEERIL